MTARAAAIGLCLAAVAAAGPAFAQDDPACAQFQAPMAYNACLARHGPKANGPRAGAGEPQRAGRGQARAPASGLGRWPHAHRVHGRVHMEFHVQ